MKYVIAASPEFDAAVEDIRVATRRANPEDVIRDAMEAWDLIVSQVKLGHRVYIGSRELQLPHLEEARRWPGLLIIDGGKKD